MSLKKVVAIMHQEARKKGKSNRSFSDGLQMQLLYREREEDVVLRLRKSKARPSEEEVKFCSSVFFFFWSGDRK